MKTLLPVVSILAVLFLVSCKEKSEEMQTQNAQPQQQMMADADVHNVVVQEVVQGTSYTYLKVKEADDVFWIAIAKSEIQTGQTISFENPLKMVNFTSKELQRTFDTIYFVSGIGNGSASAGSEHPSMNPHQTMAVEKKPISVEPVEGGISIGQLFSERDSYANKVIKIRGQVTKFNQQIMGKNWVHLQDGTGDAGSNDLLVTTQDTVNVGDVVVFEGTIALNRDFGAGYAYEVLMEEATLQP